MSFENFSSDLKHSLRKVNHLKLIFKAVSWYLQAFCHEKQEYRTFKINRMKK